MLEQVDLPLSEEQCSIDQVLSEECLNTEQSQLETTLLRQIKTKNQTELTVGKKKVFKLSEKEH